MMILFSLFFPPPPFPILPLHFDCFLLSCSRCLFASSGFFSYQLSLLSVHRICLFCPYSHLPCCLHSSYSSSYSRVFHSLHLLICLLLLPSHLHFLLHLSLSSLLLSSHYIFFACFSSFWLIVSFIASFIVFFSCLKNPLHVLMHLLDPNFGQILFLDSSHSFSLFAYAADIVFSDF